MLVKDFLFSDFVLDFLILLAQSLPLRLSNILLRLQILMHILLPHLAELEFTLHTIAFLHQSLILFSLLFFLLLNNRQVVQLLRQPHLKVLEGALETAEFHLFLAAGVVHLLKLLFQREVRVPQLLQLLFVRLQLQRVLFVIGVLGDGKLFQFLALLLLLFLVLAELLLLRHQCEEGVVGLVFVLFGHRNSLVGISDLVVGFRNRSFNRFFVLLENFVLALNRLNFLVLILPLNHQHIILVPEFLELGLLRQLVVLAVVVNEFLDLLLELEDGRLLLDSFLFSVLDFLFLIIFPQLQIANLIHFVVRHPDGTFHLLAGFEDQVNYLFGSFDRPAFLLITAL